MNFQVELSSFRVMAPSALRCVTVGLLALMLVFATFVHGSPMMYKKNDQSVYEAGEWGSSS